jgi:hypothetical protein
MRCAASFLFLLTLATGCVLEDKPVDAGTDASPDSGLCGGCVDPDPVCVESIGCVQCTADEDEYCTDQMLVCKTDEMKCVSCLDSSNCDDPGEAHCNTDTNECEECQNETDCDGIEGLSVCDAGECVQCTPATEPEKCGDKSCDPATRSCTDTVVGSQDVCETCVADSECGDEGAPSTSFRCVAMEYQGEPFPGDGKGFCLKIFSPGGCEQPYAIRITDRESLSGDPLQSYCGINELLATCPAVSALKENEICVGGEDDECPTSGLCRDVGGLPNRCTYLCGLPAQCPADPPANTCNSTGPDSDDYCGG